MSEATYAQVKGNIRSAFGGCEWTDDVGEAFEANMIPEMLRAVDMLEAAADDAEKFIKQAEAELRKKIYVNNTAATISAMRTSMGKDGEAYFDSQIAAGGGIAGQHVQLIGKGQEFYMTSGSEKLASGNFLTSSHPGATAQERKTNLQLPHSNDASRVNKVVSARGNIGLRSKVAPQEEWAKESGYEAKEGMEQIFTPTSDKEGAIHAGKYKVKE
ncbi:MAG: hypothetical protein LUH07_12695 [Lachnospiraceae bacterium]|nr:hypothetical protein [Lachnospiraceae bacterium]